MYIDAHLHIADYLDCCAADNIPAQFASPAAFCCSAHEHDEYVRHRAFALAHAQETPPSHAAGITTDDAAKLKRDGNGHPLQHGAAHTAISRCGQRHALFSFGIHPQNPVMDEADFLYHLLETKQVQAIGECGFDLFDETFKQTLPQQLKVWQLQTQWAAQFQLPLVIHCRKALPLLFESVPQLKKVPSVIFHGWGGSPQEAASFLKKGVNAYFSLGKATLRGQKSVCAMAARFEIQRLLTETDAPYMRLKAERFTHPRDIIAVTALCATLRKNPDHPIMQYDSCAAALAATAPADEELEYFSDIMEQNFYRAFGISCQNAF